MILKHLSVLWPLKHFVCAIKTRLFIYVSKLCGVYEFRYTPQATCSLFTVLPRRWGFSETRTAPVLLPRLYEGVPTPYRPGRGLFIGAPALLDCEA